MTMQADIVIVGAGMVGCTLALSLKNLGLNIIVLETQQVMPKAIQAQEAFEARVSAISIASKRVLQHVDAWPSILAQRISAYERMFVWDGSGTGYISFDAASVHQSVLGYIIENRAIQSALLDRLQATSESIKLLTETDFVSLQKSAKGWRVCLANGQTIDASLVVGADGANSKVRGLADIKTFEWDYFHHAIVTSVCCEKKHQKTAWQRFTDEGPLAFLPLNKEGDEHWCSLVWSVPPAKADEIMALDDAAFCKKLSEAFEFQLGAVVKADKRFRQPLRQRHAKHYIKQGLVLIGDAAHVIHPLAGQGVNLGFMDAATLAEALQWAHAQHLSIGDIKILHKFERGRKLHNLGMTASMEFFERIFQVDQIGIRWLRNTGLKLVNQSEELKALFIRRALGIAGTLPQMAMGE